MNKEGKYIENKYYKSEITAKVISCAYKVHKYLGCGFQEVIYQRAMELELKEAEVVFEREKDMPIIYQGQEIGRRRVDFLIDGDIMVELKAITVLDDVHVAQLMNYIEAYKVKVGLLINFGGKSLEVKRYIK